MLPILQHLQPVGFVKFPCELSVVGPQRNRVYALIQKDLALHLPSVLCGQGGGEVAPRDRLAALGEAQEGGSPILSLHHTSHLFSRLAGA